MREQQAKDFWSAYLKLILRKGQETTIVNPFEEFRDSVAKGGYESVSDEEYANIYDQVEELSVFWQQRPKDSVAHIVIEALSRTHLYEDEIQDIAGILAGSSTQYACGRTDRMRQNRDLAYPAEKVLFHQDHQRTAAVV